MKKRRNKRRKKMIQRKKRLWKRKKRKMKMSFLSLLAFINSRIMTARFLYMFYHWHNEV